MSAENFLAGSTCTYPGFAVCDYECEWFLFCRTDDGLTPCHIAAEWGNDRTLRFLLQFGADPLLKTSDGSTAMDLAARHHSGQACLRLISDWLHEGNRVNGGGARGITSSNNSANAVNGCGGSDADCVSDDLSSVASFEVADRFAEYCGGADGATAGADNADLRIGRESFRERAVKRFNKLLCCVDGDGNGRGGANRPVASVGIQCDSTAAAGGESYFRPVGFTYGNGARPPTVDELVEPFGAVEIRKKEEEKDVDAAILSKTLDMDADTLRRQLTTRNVEVGPITPQTRGLYAQRLARFIMDEEGKQRRVGGSRTNTTRKLAHSTA